MKTSEFQEFSDDSLVFSICSQYKQSLEFYQYLFLHFVKRVWEKMFKRHCSQNTCSEKYVEKIFSACFL